MTPPDPADLRRRAEEVLVARETDRRDPLSPDETLAQVHELQVHQIELELQNEELVQTRNEAETLRDQYIDLYDFAPVGYFTIDRSGTILALNLTGSVLLSASRQALIGTRIQMFLHSDFIGSFAAFCDRVLQTGLTETFEAEFSGAQESPPWYGLLRGRADPACPADRIRLVLSDITERRRVEEAVLESERHYRRLFETMLQGVVYQDTDGRIVTMNPAAERILGKSPGEFLITTPEETEHHTICVDGTPFFILDHPEMTTLQAGRELRGVVMGVYNPREQAYRWIAIQAVPLFRPGETTPYQIYTIFEDITESKKVEAVLREYGEKLRVSNEELQLFAYVASHDLQEPLRSIVSFSQLLDRRYRGRLDADADEYLGFIAEGGQRMQALIQDLLQVSRVSSAGGEFEPVDAGAVVIEVIRSLQVSIEETGAVVTVAPLPTVRSDPSQLRQVFANLIGNAIKYRGERPPEIRISADPEGEFWRFAIADNGIGIEAEYFDRIFVIFQRLHTHDEYKGTGIGLSVVKRIVERHGGRVWVKSEPDQGTTFFFTLPAA